MLFIIQEPFLQVFTSLQIFESKQLDTVLNAK